jgi:hypothetical protein
MDILITEIPVWDLTTEELCDEVKGYDGDDYDQAFAFMTRDVLEKLAIKGRVSHIGGVENIDCYESAPDWAYEWMNEMELL